MVRCKVCGYITAERRLADRCPACGALRAAFEPYKDRISSRRRRYLNLTIHPIAVHFPQAFGVSAVVLSIAPLVFRGKVGDFLVGGLKFMSLFLPLLVAVSFLAGWLDGRVRFKKIGRSQILKRKLVLASLFLASSIMLALVVWLKGVDDPAWRALTIIISLAAFVCSFWLGLLGTRVYNSEWPGD
jgi:uncharacterized membrane protein